MKYLKKYQIFESINKSRRSYNSEMIPIYVKDETNGEYEVVDIPDSISQYSNVGIRHNSCGNIWYPRINNFLIKGTRCNKCFGKRKSSISEFIDRVYHIHNGEYSVISKEYINNKTNITIKHNICKTEFNVRPDNFLNSKTKCPKCSGKRKLTIDDIKKRFYNLYNNIEYDLTINEEPKNGKDKLLIHHKKCNSKWFASVGNILYQNTGCPYCKMSKGERYIKQYLENNKISFFTQHRFDDLKYKRKIPFDFYIPKYSMCIEFDGIQHFEPIGFFGGQSSLERNKTIDKIKSDYCLNNNIRLIRIDYKNIKKINNILDEIFKKI